jgi:hypothetical protein
MRIQNQKNSNNISPRLKTGIYLGSMVVLVVLCVFILGYKDHAVNAQGTTIYYVAKNGNDSWSGKSANPSGSDGPFATLEKARNTIRSLKTAGQYPSGGVEIQIRQGAYDFPNGFELTSADNGTSTGPVVYTAYNKEPVTLVGGKVLPPEKFGAITDTAMLNAFPSAARPNIKEIDVKALGVTEYGTILAIPWDKDWFSDAYPSYVTLASNGKSMTMARWPNRLEPVATSADQAQYTTVTSASANDVKVFNYNGAGRPSWTMDGTQLVSGFLGSEFRMNRNKITALNQSQSQVTTEFVVSPHKGDKIYFENIREELDKPGEWYLNKTTGKLYFWPEVPLANTTTYIGSSVKSTISITGAENIQFKYLDIGGSRNFNAAIRNSKNILIAGCTFHNAERHAVMIDGGSDNTVRSSDFSYVDGAALIRGGNRTTLTPGNHSFINNYVFKTGRSIKTKTAIDIQGVGNNVLNNKFDDIPGQAIVLEEANNILIQYNEIGNTLLETGDAGGFYSGGGRSKLGTVIKNNFFHNLDRAAYLSPARKAIYFDGDISGATAEGNVIYKTGSGGSTAGVLNTFKNNVFIEEHNACAKTGNCGTIIVHQNSYIDYYEDLTKFPFTTPPWSTQYPDIVTWYNKYGKTTTRQPYGIKIQDNLFYHVDREITKWDENADLTKPPYSTDYKVVVSNNTTLTSDPGFINDDGKTVTLKSSHPDYSKYGFERIPLDKIGMYKDEYRGGTPTPTNTPVPTSVPTNTPLPTKTPAPTPTPVPVSQHCQPLGDMSDYPNCKGSVNSLDLSYLLSKFGSTDYKANLDDEGLVNSLDLGTLLSNLGK